MVTGKHSQPISAHSRLRLRQRTNVTRNLLDPDSRFGFGLFCFPATTIHLLPRPDVASDYITKSLGELQTSRDPSAATSPPKAPSPRIRG
ncbi:hypothetical protein OPV22_000990 [Ensete ventricosum]|uniref:Uncharacterized protein n=1 Tax=Ensete ventricosum TaxID=4639 RepID=A0AAV8QHQ3_ENSVE|nr:hypothetical protein OPV22_000990 [Ensete ventricosum]